jgi:hypothetical protein
VDSWSLLRIFESSILDASPIRDKCCSFSVASAAWLAYSSSQEPRNQGVFPAKLRFHKTPRDFGVAFFPVTSASISLTVILAVRSLTNQLSVPNLHGVDFDD